MDVLVFFIIILIVFILIIPLKIKAKVNFDFLKNRGKIKFYFFKINFLTYIFKFKKNYILLSTKKGKKIIVPLSSNNPKNLEYVDLTLILFDKTTINTLKLDFFVGVEDDPFMSAILFGAIKTISSIVFSVLKTKKLSVIVINNVNSTHNKTCGKVQIKSSLTICFADLIFGLILYLFKLRKVGNRYEARK